MQNRQQRRAAARHKGKRPGETYCDPAIDRLAGYEEFGLPPDELKSKLERLDILEKAMERLGNFGRLFRDYKGCPRGQRGESGYVPGIPHKHILLEEDPITDVEGDVWIPVLARDLYRYIDKLRWIPVKERLPDNNHPVLVRCVNTTISGGYVTHVGSCDMKQFWFLRTQPGTASFPVREWQVTHWMPLPEPPKEDVK